LTTFAPAPKRLIKIARVAPAVAGIVACACLLGACGSSSKSSSTGSSNAAATQSNSAGLTEAKSLLNTYTGHPGPFPVTVPLKSRPPAGSTVAYLDCGTPVCGLFLSALKPAAQVAGVTIKPINSGITASTTSAALDTVISEKPAAVIVPGIDPSTWGASTIANLKAAKIPVIGVGYEDGAKYGLTTYPDVVVSGPAQVKLQDKLEAAYIAVHDGPHANIAYATQPEVGFNALGVSTFTSAIKTYCPGCTVHTFPIPASDDGTTGPALVVSYLEAHSNTTVLSTVNGEAFDGLTPALKQAGLNPKVVANSGDPENLADLKAGDEQANSEVDIPVTIWTAMDAALRAIAHQPYAGGEAAGLPPVELLEPKNVTFDPAKGFTGYPNFPQMFAKLWGK
jgi:ribose transport system substrate-binding protein